MNGLWLASRTSGPLTLNGPVTLPHAAPALVLAPFPVLASPPAPRCSRPPYRSPPPCRLRPARAARPPPPLPQRPARALSPPPSPANRAPCLREPGVPSPWIDLQVATRMSASCPHVATRAITSVPLSGDGAGYGTLRGDHSALAPARDAVVTVPISPAGPPRPNSRGGLPGPRPSTAPWVL